MPENKQTEQPPQPMGFGGVISIIGLIIKLGPILIPIILGLLKALENREKTVKVDEVALSDLVRELTEIEIKKVVAKHRGKITPYVPTDEEAERQKRIDELLEELEKAQKESTPEPQPDTPTE